MNKKIVNQSRAFFDQRFNGLLKAFGNDMTETQINVMYDCFKAGACTIMLAFERLGQQIEDDNICGEVMEKMLDDFETELKEGIRFMGGKNGYDH